MNSKVYDIIVWGASGFTGKLVAEYLYKKYGINKSLKWAIAGRSNDKLKSIIKKLNPEIPIIIANVNDISSLNKMVSKTKVICTTVGPYAKYGTELVDLCIKNRTHYCDLAGEVQWIRKIIDKFHYKAVESKVKIVNSCGFDSIPSDLGVFYIQEKSKKIFGTKASRIEMRVAGAKGGISGGTYASLSNVNIEAHKNKEIFKTLINPYGLNPVNEIEGPDGKDLRKIVFDPYSKTWIGPFVMAAINTKIVRRSNALSGYSYGKNFMYNEAVISGKGSMGKIKAYMMALPLFILSIAKPNSSLKKIIDFFLPKPGQGPSKKNRESGFYNLRFYVNIDGETKALAKVVGDMDPGYGSTSKMLAESAVSLAKDNLNESWGILTPSVAMGKSILKRLRDNAGLTFNFKKI